MFQRTGIGNDASGRNSALAQCPQKVFVTLFLLGFAFFDLGNRPSNPLIGFVDGAVNRHAIFGF